MLRICHRRSSGGREKISCDAQFHFINDAVLAALAENHPVISVDTKKKELAGDFKNAGREWRPQGMGGRRADYRTIPLHPRLRATGNGHSSTANPNESSNCRSR